MQKLCKDKYRIIQLLRSFLFQVLFRNWRLLVRFTTTIRSYLSLMQPNRIRQLKEWRGNNYTEQYIFRLGRFDELENK